ncbi:hypothetical protein C8R43DRAFT_1235392 [Mycena crocata]|nr:hypothetical protein C8R43DRAFT_1235392 [Mycena crocata]
MLTTANELRTRLQRFDADIAQHELSLRSLREARTAILEELRLALIYPVLTLPFEITSQIFLDCLPRDSFEFNRRYPSQDEAPVVFTRVCRSWRAVALSTSALWTNVHIELDSDDGSGHIDSKWVALLAIWFQRSHPQPLSVVVSNRSYTDPDETLIAVLEYHSPRWRDATLKLPFNHFSRLGAPASLPLLERLTLSAHGSPDMINPISAFRHAPLLQHVCLEAGMHPSDLILPWGQLTTVEFYGATADDCLELLHLVPNVVTCILDVQYASHALSLGSPLMSLRSFTFSGPAGWGILRYMTMPALQELDLTRCPPGPRNITQLFQFVARSECQLRYLKLYVRAAVMAQTIHLLRALPSLATIELTLAETDIGTAIFRELNSDAAGDLLPHVESIFVRCMHDDNYHILFDVVSDLLDVRAQQAADAPNQRIAELASFTLLIDSSDAVPNAEIRKRWRVISAKGINLRIESSHERWI